MPEDTFIDFREEERGVGGREREREREMERRERNTDTKEKHRLVASPPRIEPVGRWSSLPRHTGQGKQEVS